MIGGTLGIVGLGSPPDTGAGTQAAPDVCAASGFTSTIFGGPQAPPALRAAGWSGILGAPHAVDLLRATSLSASLRFGAPATPTYSEHRATGWLGTRFGTPYGLTPFTHGAENSAVQASGWRAAQFGTPSATTNSTHEVAGWLATSWGTPRAAAALQAQSLSPTAQFGTPALTARHRAQGFRPTQFGTPSLTPGHVAQGFSRTRFSTPRASTPGATKATGWNGTRFGHPKASTVAGGLRAEGWQAAQFGTPAATNRHRTQTLGCGTRFGRPTLRRTPLC